MKLVFKALFLHRLIILAKSYFYILRYSTKYLCKELYIKSTFFQVLPGETNHENNKTRFSMLHTDKTRVFALISE